MKTGKKLSKLILIVVLTLSILSTVVLALNNSGQMNNTNILSREKMIELYDSGYGVQDIEKAQENATKYNITIDEVLLLKGKTTDKKNTRKWENVLVELEVKKTSKEMGESKEKIKQTENLIRDMEKNGSKLEEKEAKKILDELNKDLKNKNKITDSEIKQAEKLGITEISDISIAKNLVTKYNGSLDDVLIKYKNKKFWTEVEKDLGGNEK